MLPIEIDQYMDRVAEHALDARRRIEAAVDAGELPVWVMEACETWERAAMAYGAGMARRDMAAHAEPADAGQHALH